MDKRERLVVRGGTDVRSHCHCREEMRCSPLHIHTLESIGVVAHPELVEVRQIAPVGPSTSRSTVLDDEVGIFCTNALKCLYETAMVFNKQMTLFVGREILRAVVRDVHVGIPLDVVNLRVFRHQLVDCVEHKVLHLRVAHVKH